MSDSKSDNFAVAAPARDPRNGDLSFAGLGEIGGFTPVYGVGFMPSYAAMSRGPAGPDPRNSLVRFPWNPEPASSHAVRAAAAFSFISFQRLKTYHRPIPTVEYHHNFRHRKLGTRTPFVWRRLRGNNADRINLDR